MEEFVLIRPTTEFERQISEYRQAFLDCGDSMDGCGQLRKFENIQGYINFCSELEKSPNGLDGFVPSTQLILVRKSDNKLVGMLDIRHYLNDYLEKFGGHIGYSILPCERKKGYAKQMLKMSLPICEEIGLTKLLLTCNESNLVSEKTILANGGIYESTIVEPGSNKVIKRFWISLKKAES